jgi:hypothetical protein
VSEVVGLDTTLVFNRYTVSIEMEQTMEQMMACLLAEIRTNQERMEAKLGAEKPFKKRWTLATRS